MTYPIKLEGFEGQRLELQPAGVFAGPKLLVNGHPAAQGPKRGQMALRRNDGREVVAAWKPQFLGLDVPQLVVDGRSVRVVEPLPWYVWLWSALPILLVFLGGALGALAGFIGFAINTKLFRSSWPVAAKFGLTAVVSLVTVVIYFGVATLIYIAIGR